MVSWGLHIIGWFCCITTSIHIPNDINIAIFKEHVSGLINNYTICMECKCKTTYSSTITKLEFTLEVIYTYNSKTA